MNTENIPSKMNDKERQKGKKQSFLKELWRRLLKNKSAVVALCIICVFISIALTVTLWLPYERAIMQNARQRLLPPGTEGHIFGTDGYGRDMFARIMYGARISMFIGFVVASFELVIGGCLGAVAAYYGKLTENIIMRIMDMLATIPHTLLALCIVAALGAGMTNLLIALVISDIPVMTRIVRSTMLSVVEMEYIEAARACGTKDARIIWRHILPNGIGPIIVQATRAISSTILTAAGLSYIGLGVQPPTPEWGYMLSEGRERMLLSPYLMIIPGVAIVIAALSFEIFGDGLRDAMDPRLKD